MAKVKYSPKQLREAINTLLGRTTSAEEQLAGPERSSAIEAMLKATHEPGFPPTKMVRFQDYGGMRDVGETATGREYYTPGRPVTMPEEAFLQSYMQKPEQFGPGNISNLMRSSPVHAVEPVPPGSPEEVISGLAPRKYTFGTQAVPKDLREAFERASGRGEDVLGKRAAAYEGNKAWKTILSLKKNKKDKWLWDLWDEIYADSMEKYFPKQGSVKVKGVIRRLKGEPLIREKGAEVGEIGTSKLASREKPSSESWFKDLYYKYKTDPEKYYRKYEREFDYFEDLSGEFEKRAKPMIETMKKVEREGAPGIPVKTENVFRVKEQEPLKGIVPMQKALEEGLTGPGMEEMHRLKEIEQLPKADKLEREKDVKRKEKLIMALYQATKGGKVSLDKARALIEKLAAEGKASPDLIGFLD